MTGFFKMVTEGGMIFTIPIMLLTVLILGLLANALREPTLKDLMIKRITSIGLFALSLGILGQVIGLMSGFKLIEEIGQISPVILAGGVRISFIATFFGLFAFLVGRLSILLLEWRS
jgi:hypothetical protein